MAAKKAKLPTPPKPKIPAQRVKKPGDYLRGGKTHGTTVGENYTAWNTYGQGKPDFGKGPGPGEPYHEVQKKVQTPLPGPKGRMNPPKWAPGPTLPKRPGGTLPFTPPGNKGKVDARLAAIKRRLQGVK